MTDRNERLKSIRELVHDHWFCDNPNCSDVEDEILFLLALVERLIRENTAPLDMEYLIGQLMSCVERAEGFADGGPITREAEKHLHAWRRRAFKAGERE